MDFFEPMAFRYVFLKFSYGLPKNDRRLVCSRRLRRARPNRVTMLAKFTIAFFIPNVTFRESLKIMEKVN
jgi:hypothetical protein